LPERKYKEIKAKLKIEPEDFWMFDEETIFTVADIIEKSANFAQKAHKWWL
jgi:hypothetical protein